jgi:hypothetical protein
VVDGEPLPEYDDVNVPHRETAITKYIEVRAGDEFKIRHKYTAPFPTHKGITVSSSIDGVTARRPSVRRDEILRVGGFEILGQPNEIWGGMEVADVPLRRVSHK